MKRIIEPFVRIKNNNVEEGHYMILQTSGYQFVAGVSIFSRHPRGEYGRKIFLSNRENPYFVAKAKGLRIYTWLYGALQYISPEEREKQKEQIHQILYEMAEFYASEITDGMRRQYADATEPIKEYRPE